MTYLGLFLVGVLIGVAVSLAISVKVHPRTVPIPPFSIMSRVRFRWAIGPRSDYVTLVDYPAFVQEDGSVEIPIAFDSDEAMGSLGVHGMVLMNLRIWPWQLVEGGE